jgi:hypothetical protein
MCFSQVAPSLCNDCAHGNLQAAKVYLVATKVKKGHGVMNILW